jgi:hypothetical protein
MRLTVSDAPVAVKRRAVNRSTKLRTSQVALFFLLFVCMFCFLVRSYFVIGLWALYQARKSVEE